MAKPELGTKRVCPETGRKFYDLNKNPVISPYTGKVVPVEPLARARPEPPAAAVRVAPAPVEEVAAPSPPMRNSSRSRRPTPRRLAARRRSRPLQRRPRSKKKNWGWTTRAWTTPRSSKSRRKKTPTSPISSAAIGRTRRKADPLFGSLKSRSANQRAQIKVRMRTLNCARPPVIVIFDLRFPRPHGRTGP